MLNTHFDRFFELTNTAFRGPARPRLDDDMDFFGFRHLLEETAASTRCPLDTDVDLSERRSPVDPMLAGAP